MKIILFLLQIAVVFGAVPDGGFELGTAGPWQYVSVTDSQLICCGSNCGGLAAYEGNCWTRLGGTGSGEESIIMQNITIETGTTHLLFYLWMIWENPSTNQAYFQIQIDQYLIVNVTSQYYSDFSGEYTSAYVAIDPFFVDGQTHRLAFYHSNLNGNYRNLIDNVQLIPPPATTSRAQSTFATTKGLTTGITQSAQSTFATTKGLTTGITQSTFATTKGLTTRIAQTGGTTSRVTNQATGTTGKRATTARVTTVNRGTTKRGSTTPVTSTSSSSSSNHGSSTSTSTTYQGGATTTTNGERQINTTAVIALSVVAVGAFAVLIGVGVVTVFLLRKARLANAGQETGIPLQTARLP